jgi:hypothetical protein
MVKGYLYTPFVSRVAGQIDGATRRVPKGMAQSLARRATKSRRDLATTRRAVAQSACGASIEVVPGAD